MKTYVHLSKEADEYVKSLEAENATLRADCDKLQGRRRHTQEWYASHYGKLEDWARKILPEPWRNQFFNCIANGTWGHQDVGERYTCNAGFDVVPGGYIHMDDAKGQLIIDQTKRAEDAEAENASLCAEVVQLKECVVIACRSGRFGNPQRAAANIIASVKDGQ